MHDSYVGCCFATCLVYVKAAKKIKGDDKILIAYEWHFQNANSCIEQLGIKRLDLDRAVDFLNAM